MAAVFSISYINPIFPPLKRPIKPPFYSQPLPLKIPTQFPTVGFKSRFNRTAVAAVLPAVDGSSIMWPVNGVMSDACATVVSGGVALGLLRLWQETAKRGVFDKKLNRKLVHISIGLAFMLCWPLFSSGYRGILLASLIPGVNILRMLVIGLGIQKDDATVKSMSRFGDHRELLKGPMYYAATITFASIYYWRTSPIGIGAVCNLCAGDGLADIVGRRFGKHKLPYNKDKSFEGSIAMLVAGFLASVAFMLYFSHFGFIPVSWDLVTGLFCMSLASTVVESLPISTTIDDNLTVSLTSFLVGSLFF